MGLVRSLVRPSRYLFKKLEVPFWSGIISKKSLFVQKRYLFDSKISQKIPFVSNRYLFFSQKGTLKRYLYTIFLRSFNLKKRLFNKSKISKKEKKISLCFQKRYLFLSEKVPFWYFRKYVTSKRAVFWQIFHRKKRPHFMDQKDTFLILTKRYLFYPKSRTKVLTRLYKFQQK